MDHTSFGHAQRVRARPLRPHLVDATVFFSPTSGGVRRYLLVKHEWLNAHSRVRHSLFVPGPRDAGAAGGVVEFASPLVHAGYRCPVRLPALRAALAALGPDLIEAGDPYLMGWQVAEVAESLQIPAVAFCHSDLIGLLQSGIGRVGAALATRYLRSLYGRFDLIFAPSRIVANRLRDAGIEHVVVQPLGVDATVFQPGLRDTGLRRWLGLPADARLLVFAGRLAPEKNLPELYAMVERLGAPYHLLVIGGEAESRPTPHVTVLPYEDDAAVIAAQLAACDLLVHAGRRETFGLVALEAMACGLPVVAYDAGALAELVDDSVGALAPANGRAAALADAVADVFARGPQALGAAARERVLAHYSWDAAFAHQMRYYALLLDQASLLRDSPTMQPARG